MLFIIPMTYFLISWCIMIVQISKQPSMANAIGLIVGLIFVAFGGYGTVKLWIREIRMLNLLRRSWNADRAIRYAQKYDIRTFQSDQALSEKRIALLEEQIASIVRKLEELEKHRQQLLEEQLQYIREAISNTETSLEIVNKEITKISDDFDHVKKLLLFFGLIYVLFALIQSTFTMEYAFRNDIIPVYMKREELLEVRANQQKELEDIIQKKMELGLD